MPLKQTVFTLLSYVFPLTHATLLSFFITYRKSTRKDTGYSTGSSHTSGKHRKRRETRSCDFDEEDRVRTHGSRKLRRTDKETHGRKKIEEELSEESQSVEYQPTKSKDRIDKTRKYERKVTVSVSTSDPSSE